MEFENLSIEDESKRFIEHLSIENNNRIIFSGIFGIGKTYFIDHFFKSHENDFIQIKLNPVNYSISQNEDIFELIKFDIGFQLFKENPEFEKVKIHNLLATQFYLRENYNELIQGFVENLAKLDHRVNSVVNPILKLKDKIRDYKNQNTIDEEGELKRFLNEFKLKKGTFREENSITELINVLIQTLKQNFPDKQTVLIIDDLDRIDPGHIFRILNIFSAHFDYYDIVGENKFGFDKVILICDIFNVKGIFHNQYGSDIDFSGYIDKFYSLEVFEYNFSNVIISSLDRFFKSIKSNSNTVLANISSNSNNYYTKELSFLLSYFIQSNCLSMRTLVNFLKINYNPSNLTIKTNSSYRIYTSSTPIIIIFDLLIALFGGIENLKFVLDKTIKRFPLIDLNTHNNYWNLRIGNIIMLLDYDKNYLKPRNEIFTFHSNEFNVKVDYEINSIDYGVVGNANQIGYAGMNSEILNLNDVTSFRIQYFQILKQSIQVYEQLPKQRG